MKKAVLWLWVVVIFLLFPAFQKAEISNSFSISTFPQTKPQSLSPAITLTVICLSNRTQPLGGSFQHMIKLMEGTSAIVNAEVKINDPIGRICTSVTTDSKGEATWFLSIPLDTKPLCYSIEFYHGNIKQYSGVAVTSSSEAVVLPSYSMDLNSSDSLDSRSLVMASRGGFTNTLQAPDITLKEVSQFGLAVAKDYLRNPFNIATVTIAFFSCSAGQLVPGAGQTACIVSAKMVATGITTSSITVLLNKGIEASNFTETVKSYLKEMLTLGTIAYSVARLNPAEGLSNIDALGGSFDLIQLIKNTYGQLIYNEKGILKGASFPAQKAGSSEVYMMCIYNRDSTNQIASQPSKDPNCKENYTGDYCFQNNTKLDLEVGLKSSPSKTRSYTSPFTCTLRPGQKQCFFDVPAGSARYTIKTPATFNGYGSTNVPKAFYAEGSLYVEQCKENTFFINLETASYSSNIPAQTNQNQASKDANCKENNTGDFCFQNTTKLDLEVTFMSSPSKTRGYTSPFTCTLQPGQKQCFFDVPAGPAKYTIKTPATFNGYGSTNFPKSYFTEGSLYVESCLERTFVIK